MNQSFRPWPESLQVVLSSPVKLELLCLLQRGAMLERELCERLSRPVGPHLISVHVRTLEDRGWIVAERRPGKTAGYDVHWALSTHGADWAGLVRMVHRFAPRPVAAAAPAPDGRRRGRPWR